jgi:hypothetical protein
MNYLIRAIFTIAFNILTLFIIRIKIFVNIFIFVFGFKVIGTALENCVISDMISIDIG